MEHSKPTASEVPLGVYGGLAVVVVVCAVSLGHLRSKGGGER